MAPQFLATFPCCSGAFAAATLSRYALAGAGAPCRRGMLSLEAPTGLLASKSGRFALAAAAAPGGSDDGLPSDREGVLSAFRFEMQVFKTSQRPVALLGETEELLDTALGTAKDCIRMMDQQQGCPSGHIQGHAFLIVEGQSEGYVRADTMVNAIQGLKLIGKAFFDGANLPEHTAPAVPLSGEDVDKESYFQELVNLFVVCYTALYWEAYSKYGLDSRSAN